MALRLKSLEIHGLTICVKLLGICGAQNQIFSRTTTIFINDRQLHKNFNHLHILDLVVKFKDTGSATNK